mgnify:CR=1 FL=1
MLIAVLNPINYGHYLPNDKITNYQKSKNRVFCQFLHLFLLPPPNAIIISPTIPITNVKMKPKASLDISNFIHSLHPVKIIDTKAISVIIINLDFIFSVFKSCTTFRLCAVARRALCIGIVGVS